MYAKPLPKDRNNESMQEYPAPVIALARNVLEQGTISSVILLNEGTTAIEIGAVAGSAVMRWVATSDTQASVISITGTANYDHVIPTGTVRRFVVPVESNPASGYPSLVLANREYGLYRRIAIKSVIAAASVLTSEY